MSYILLEFLCTSCGGKFESLETRSDNPQSIIHPPCDAMAERVLSAPAVKTVWGYAATRGKSDPCPPNVLNTEGMGDGQSQAEFRKERAEHHRERRYQQRMKAGGTSVMAD